MIKLHQTKRVATEWGSTFRAAIISSSLIVFAMIPGLVFWLVSAAVGVGCGKSPDYLYHVTPKPPNQFEFNQRVKEITGNEYVDIVWVIDNSGSMSTHQQNVINNAELFMKSFIKNQALKWQMAILSTDENDPSYLGMQPGAPFDYSDPDPVGTFKRVVSKLGTNGSSTEKTFRPLKNQITKNANWLRKDAILAMIVVSDAPEQSNISGADMLAFLTQAKGSLKNTIFYGILGPQDLGCPQTDDRWDYKGSPFETVITGTKGKFYLLCTPDFGTALADLGADLVKRITSPKIGLQARPKMDTLKVFYHETQLAPGPKESGGLWYYDYWLNAVVFYDLAFALGDQESVKVQFQEDNGL